MTMIEVKTSELIGPALDWAVAKAEGDEHWTSDRNIDWFAWRMRNWKPSTDWAQCGPLIEKYMIRTQYAADTEKRADAGCLAQTWRPYALAHGDTLLIAACRAIVAAELGDTVQVPKELMADAAIGEDMP